MMEDQEGTRRPLSPVARFSCFPFLFPVAPGWQEEKKGRREVIEIFVLYRDTMTSEAKEYSDAK